MLIDSARENQREEKKNIQTSINNNNTSFLFTSNTEKEFD